MNWLGKDLPYWATFAGMALYLLFMRGQDQPLRARVVSTAIAALLGVGLSPSLAVYLGWAEVVVCAGVMAFGVILLDILTGLLSDRELVRDIIKARLGKDE